MKPDHAAVVLYSAPDCPYSHRARFVLAEKSVDDYRVVDIDPDEPSETLAQANPAASVPTLVDRGVAVYGDDTLAEYLDERYPYPPLMPVSRWPAPTIGC